MRRIARRTERRPKASGSRHPPSGGQINIVVVHMVIPIRRSGIGNRSSRSI